jgi:N-acetylmuramoyl-L-alanine amidase
MGSMTTATTSSTSRPALEGLRVAVDVQHLFKPPPHSADRGTYYRLAATGAHVYEADCALLYAHALAHMLRGRGAQVMENDPAHAVLTGSYARRNAAATAWHADAYLACHLNAGGGGYALTESLSLSPGLELGRAIGFRLARNFASITQAKIVQLHSQDRGAVCVRGCAARCAAVIVEPLFGDNPAHQGYLIAPELVRLGETIAQGVADWWFHRTPFPPPA